MRVNNHPEDEAPPIVVEGLVNRFGDFAVHDGLDLTGRSARFWAWLADRAAANLC